MYLREVEAKKKEIKQKILTSIFLMMMIPD